LISVKTGWRRGVLHCRRHACDSAANRNRLSVLPSACRRRREQAPEHDHDVVPRLQSSLGRRRTRIAEALTERRLLNQRIGSQWTWTIPNRRSRNRDPGCRCGPCLLRVPRPGQEL